MCESGTYTTVFRVATVPLDKLVSLMSPLSQEIQSPEQGLPTAVLVRWLLSLAAVELQYQFICAGNKASSKLSDVKHHSLISSDSVSGQLGWTHLGSSAGPARAYSCVCSQPMGGLDGRSLFSHPLTHRERVQVYFHGFQAIILNPNVQAHYKLLFASCLLMSH